jgi:GNAT superfamily N-acetyltransferase
MALSLSEAIEVFVHSFSQVKSQTYPYLPCQVGNLWVMRDDPPRTKERKIEVIAHGITPQETTEAIKGAGLGWHFLCHIHRPDEDFQDIRNQYKQDGYRAISTEWLFIHDLQAIPVLDSDPQPRQIQDQAEWNTIPMRSKQSMKLRPSTRLFSVWDETTDYGWVRSVPYKDSAWVSNLYVHEPVRGKGYGRALMSKLLISDRENGVKQSVLLASSDGARLYPHLGYQQIGILQMFCPVKRLSV